MNVPYEIIKMNTSNVTNTQSLNEALCFHLLYIINVRSVQYTKPPDRLCTPVSFDIYNKTLSILWREEKSQSDAALILCFNGFKTAVLFSLIS